MVTVSPGADTPKRSESVQEKPYSLKEIGTRLHELQADFDAARFGSPTPAHVRKPVVGHVAATPGSIRVSAGQALNTSSLNFVPPSGQPSPNLTPLVPPGNTIRPPKPVRKQRKLKGSNSDYREPELVGWPTLNTARLHLHDWATLALEWVRMYPEPFGAVYPVPRNGLFASALEKHVTVGAALDVFAIDRVTTGRGVVRFLDENNIIDGAAFAVAVGWMLDGAWTTTGQTEFYLRPVYKVPRGVSG